jgi:hypothetical protein
VKVKLAARTSVRNERFIEFVKGEAFVFIKQPFRFLDWLIGSERGKEAVGRGAFAGFRASISRNLAKNLANLSTSQSKSFRWAKEICFDHLMPVRGQKKNPPLGEVLIVLFAAR